ncbi:hypothetical protein V5P93_000842 [Actinokineospora auranticolor]|uniref:Small secreted domain DUF320 n=1 Tax=Actinokineospora auranticolor TaxID=155976 RepID=A0A2S6GYP9_9PSEU|nr:hypothetical protein [Actinokineospora auranticolor]PPK70281.1 hypothetical protein CLV40_102192 [Actinokineospora auranticolor]
MTGTRKPRAMPLAGALAAAAVLAGVAVFTVSNAGCASAGQYVQHGNEVELVGGCVDPTDLPAAPGTQPVGTSTGHAVDRYNRVSP